MDVDIEVLMKDIQREVSELCKYRYEDTSGAIEAYNWVLYRLKEICVSNQRKLAVALQACERPY